MKELRRIAAATLAVALSLVLLVVVSQGQPNEFELALQRARTAAQQLDARDATKLCEKRTFIITKIDTLLERLKKERSFLNITDIECYEEFNEAFSLWLDTESVYRLAKEQWHRSKNAAQYTLFSLNVAQRVAKLMSKNVEKVIEEYPVKKKGIDGERNLILMLIDLVKSLSSSMHGKVGEAKLKAIRSQVLALKRDFKEKKAMKELSLVSTKLDTAQLGQISEEEMSQVKKAILDVLMELLKDPDFRLFVLKTGMAQLIEELKTDEDHVQDLQKKSIDYSEEADAAKAKTYETESVRKKREGDKITKEEDYNDEHKDYLVKYPSVDRSIYILSQIRKKICTYCKTGKWAVGAAQDLLECCEEYSRRKKCKATETCQWHTNKGCIHDPKEIAKFNGK